MGIKIWLPTMLFLLCGSATAQIAFDPPVDYPGSHSSYEGRRTTADLNIESRVAYQRAIEQVYWQHRIWPAGNPGGKPPLEAMLPSELLTARVVDGLRKAEALKIYWSRPITAEELDAEMRRMASGTRAPDTLQELWAALDNDPLLVAECLVRPVLADRLIRHWYAFDQRFHGPLRTQAEQALERHGTIDQMPLMGGQHEQQLWRKAPANEGFVPDGQAGEIVLTEQEWANTIADVLEIFGVTEEASSMGADAVPLQTLSPLREDEHRFYVTAVLGHGPDTLSVATVEWDKVPFEQWWSNTQATLDATADVVANGAELPMITGASCTDDTWSPLRHVPKERDQHVAVWTGSEMIVWGGAFCATDLIPGGRYDPATDSWITINASAAPAGRYGASGVWTGTELIVWGGGWCGSSGSGGVENSGGALQPAHGWVDADQHIRRRPQRPQRSHRCVDRHGDDRLGRRARRTIVCRWRPL